MKTKPNFIHYLFAIAGLIAFVGAIYLNYKNENFLKTAKTAQGKIVDITEFNSDKSRSYFPVVEFTTKNAEKIEFKASVGSKNQTEFRIGKNIEILYNPNNPHEADIKKVSSIFETFLAMGVLGFIFFLIGFLPIRKAYSKNK